MHDDTYIGIDGKPWKVMTYPDALDIVTWLAEDSYHVDAEHQAWLSRNMNAPEEQEVIRLGQAIETVTAFAKTFRSKLHALKPPRLGTGWPEFVYADHPSLNPFDPLHAIRICLASATTEFVDPAEADRLNEQYGGNIKQRSEDMVRSLLGIHGFIISKWPEITVGNDPEASSDARIPGPV